MAENNATAPAQRRKKTPESTPVPIVDIIFLTLRKWPWILLSLIVCVGAAMIYILRTPDVYTRATEINQRALKRQIGRHGGVCRPRPHIVKHKRGK